VVSSPSMEAHALEARIENGRVIVEDKADLPDGEIYVLPFEPAGAKPQTRRMQYDDLYRVNRISYEYTGSDDVWTDPFADETAAHFASPSEPEAAIDPRRALPTPHVAFTTRMKRQDIFYDWLGNTSATTDDYSPGAFYDRSLGNIENGALSAGPYQLRAAADPGMTWIRTSSGRLRAHYDEAGNMVRMDLDRNRPCLPATAGCSQTYIYDWDEVNRLTRARRFDAFDLNPDDPPDVSGVNPSVELVYAYNSDDQRVLKTAKSATQERHTLYVFPTLELRRAAYAAGLADDEVDADYELTATTEVPYLLAGGVRLGRVVYEPNLHPGVEAGGNQRIFLTLADHLGSTSIIIDHATSELVERGTYQAYGGSDSTYRSERWNAFREDYRFTGKEEDVEVGLTYFGKRFLNPLLGRWMSPDPLEVHSPGEADGNLYAYVSGKALTAIDPLGLVAQQSQRTPDTKDGTIQFDPNRSAQPPPRAKPTPAPSGGGGGESDGGGGAAPSGPSGGTGPGGDPGTPGKDPFSPDRHGPDGDSGDGRPGVDPGRGSGSGSGDGPTDSDYAAGLGGIVGGDNSAAGKKHVPGVAGLPFGTCRDCRGSAIIQWLYATTAIATAVFRHFDGIGGA
jgi:RHS repeat-associated protein